MGAPIDYAIIGGGIAGSYAAWRLAKEAKPGSVHLFEATSRVGGRLLTGPMPGLAFRAELGGMRYTNRQLILSNLVETLKLPSRPFEFDTSLFFLRGRHFGPTSMPPYSLGLRERRKGAGGLILHAIRCALSQVEIRQHRRNSEMDAITVKLRALSDESSPLDISLLTNEQWFVLKRFGELHGTPLYETGFWNLLQYYLSSEGFLYAHDGLGYESILANWNAAEAIPWFLRDFDVKYRTVVKGMDTIPAALDFEFVRTHPDCRHLRHTLVSIESIRDGTYKLTFQTENGKAAVDARHVILALPKEPLKKILISNAPGSSYQRLDELLVELNSVTEQPLFKLFLGYRQTWWKDPRALSRESGRTVTDLPIRQVYYFPATGVLGSDDPGGVLMASYNDSHYVDFWKPLHRREEKTPHFKGELNSLTEEERNLLQAYGASDRMVTKAHRQIRLLHPELNATEGIPDPYVGLVMEWSDEPPYYYGWHTWRVSTKPWQVMNNMKQPFAKSKIFICGEAYSAEQGWAEGALRSTELVLKELAVAPPDFVTPDAYLKEGFANYESYVGYLNP